MRREGELAIRKALGATAGALRKTLLAQSLLLCGAGGVLGVLVAYPAVAVLARYASRFSVRALDLAMDSSLLWAGAALAVVAAVLLAFVYADSPGGMLATPAPASHPAPGTWHLAPRTSHLAPGTWHLAPRTWHLAPTTHTLTFDPSCRILNGRSLRYSCRPPGSPSRKARSTC